VIYHARCKRSIPASLTLGFHNGCITLRFAHAEHDIHAEFCVLAGDLLSRGETVTQRALVTTSQHRAVSMADLLTAAVAATHRLTVIHYNADFETAATVLTFEHRWVASRGSV
jgi:hypothetical protein